LLAFFVYTAPFIRYTKSAIYFFTLFFHPHPRKTIMFKEGLLILATGMTGAFLFLYVMVLIMKAMEKPIARLNHLLPDPADKR